MFNFCIIILGIYYRVYSGHSEILYLGKNPKTLIVSAVALHQGILVSLETTLELMYLSVSFIVALF